MIPEGTLGLFLGVMSLGAVHGILPDHGWPVASMYSINQKRPWLHGIASGFILGFGHLVSSITVVLVYFWALTYFDLTDIHGLHYIAGAMLIILGVREYMRGGHSHDHNGSRSHGHGDGHDHGHSDHNHGEHAHDNHSSRLQRLLNKIKVVVPFVRSEEAHEHTKSLEEQADERGLYGIAVFAFLLGFSHNEEIEIIAICTGSNQCLELMFAYALTVLVAVMTMTLLLIAGFGHYQEQIEKYKDYLPTVTAAVLILMGIGFMAGLF